MYGDTHPHWNTSAKRKRSSYRGPYASHTDRYQRDPEYRAQCIVNHRPEWLMWADGTWYAMGGSGRA